MREDRAVSLSGKWSIKAMVFIAPAIVIVLMLVAIVVFDQALRHQQAAFLNVVHGPLARATTTTSRLLVTVSEVQADVLRYAQLRQRLAPDDNVLNSLRQSIQSQFGKIQATFDALKAELEGSGEVDVVGNIEDFLTIHQAVSTRMISGAAVDTVAVSTVMAHYQQLQGYISELAERSLETAQTTADETEAYVSRLSRLLLIGSLAIIGLSIAVTWYIGRVISKPMVEMIGILTAIAAGKPVSAVPGQHRRDEIGAMARAVAVFDQVTRALRDREKALEEAWQQAELRTRDLTRSLADLRLAQERLIQTEKLASLGQLTAGIAHEIKNPLNFVNNFSALSVELIDELQQTIQGASIHQAARAEVEEIAGMLKGNLEKVVQHGKRADSIVKNMLLHSREGSGEHRLADVNALVEESLTLAYHGARAEKQGFNITLERSLDPEAGEVDLYPQEVTRVLLNLISNGFYATSKRAASEGGDSYEPTLTAATKSLGDSVEISIRDNGTGIPPEVRDKMFNPFFTTKPAGEGTGLGLSLSHDIIVKQHGGLIEVESEPGQYTEFRIVLPRAAAAIAQAGGTA